MIISKGRLLISRAAMVAALVAIFMVFAMGNVGAQSSNTNPNQDKRAYLRVFSKQLDQEVNDAHSRARIEAFQRGMPMQRVLSNGSIISLQKFVNGRPRYYMTTNFNAADTSSVDELWPGRSLGLNLTGQGQVLGIWDSGNVRASHREFQNRVTNRDFGFDSQHSTHVAGTMIASGENPSARGMASGATLIASNFDGDLAEMAAEQLFSPPIRVSNHSYGFVTGWQFDFFGDGRWVWFGNLNTSIIEDSLFGFYDSTARTTDQIIYNSPNYLVVYSAGNERDDAGISGLHWHYVGNTRVLGSDFHPPDGGAFGYDTIAGGASNAKNVITVGAVNDIPGGYSSPAGVSITGFSSWGPTDDGRIKPDLSANGFSLLSSLALHDGAYGFFTGTSMAAPIVSGGLALLAQHAENLLGNELTAASLKGLAIHTANEAGFSPGPDYSYGWGLFNAAAAANLLSAHATSVHAGHVFELNLNEGEIEIVDLVSEGGAPLKVTLSWTDLPGITPAETVDPTNLMLINDLDMRVIAPDGTEFFPWVLDPSNPSAAATTGDNFRDNLEQVVINSPQPGNYRVQISHKSSLSGGGQAMSLIVSGNSDLSPIPTPPQIISIPNLEAALGVPYSYDGNSAVEVTGSIPISFELISSPTGMQIDANGVISWLPVFNQLGAQEVVIRATNFAGSDTQSFNVNVLAQAPALDFIQNAPDSYTEEDKTGSVLVEDGGSTLHLAGNRWQKVDFSYTVTPNTMIEFDFRSTAQGEIHAIGFDDDLILSPNRAFRVYGTQNWGNGTFDDYPGGGVTRRYVIPVGQFYTGDMQYLFFAMDHDAAASGNSFFSNVRVYEDFGPPPQIVSSANTEAQAGVPYLYDGNSNLEATGAAPVIFELVAGPNGMTVSASGVVSWVPSIAQLGDHPVHIRAVNTVGEDSQQFTINVTEQLPYLNFNTLVPSGYTSEDRSGTVSVENGGYTLHLAGNRWQKVDFPYTITPDTVIEFDFYSTSQGEIHGIGLDNDLVLSPDRTFQLYGTQNWGNLAFANYPGGGVVRRYVIRVGQFYTGLMQYLFFVMDHDSGASGNSFFSNLLVYEDPPEPPAPVSPQITSTPNTSATVGVPYSYDANNTLEVTGTTPISYSLNVAPAGMTISNSGAVSWTPETGQLGLNSVEIEVSNVAGTDTQSFDINVADVPVNPGLNFNDYTVSPYVASEDKTGTVTIEDNGATLHLVGNRWKKIDFPYTVTPDTVIEFDFRSTVQGEIHGIGLDNDQVLSPERTFRVYGTQSWGNGDYDNYPGGGVTRHYVIPVGQFYTGLMQYLFFAMDHDSGASGDSFFSNVQVYENTPEPPAPTPPQITSTPNTSATVGSPYGYDANNTLEVTGSTPISYTLNVAPAGMTISPGGVVSWTPEVGQLGANSVEIEASNVAGSDTQSFVIDVAAAPVNPPINFNNYTISSYIASEDRSGTATIEDNGATLRLVGNRWKKINFPYTITANTVIEFDFRSNAQGEIHGIGLDNDQVLSPERTFRVYGTQNWGDDSFNNYPGGGVTRHYVIPVGQFYTGLMQYLFFAMDHDAGASGESVFTNVRVYENTATAPEITSTPNTSATVDSAYNYDADSTIEVTGTLPINYSLNVAPNGMTISNSGVISWTPQIGQEGANTVEIQVSNSAGVDIQTFDIMVAPNNPPLNFNNFILGPYAGTEDNAGVVAIQDGGATLHMAGNRWQKIDFPYTITPNTVIEFDFRSNAQGDIHGIGLDNDLTLSSNRTFRLYGTQNWGISNFDNYPGGGVTQHYVIPVGQFYVGSAHFLFFVMDHDFGGTGESYFSNVRIYEQ